jgi:CHASE2 domain-containing sensor protein
MMKSVKRFFTEYLALNCFIFVCVWLLSLLVLNVSFFDPFAQAFRDFTITDLYYNKLKDQNQIYKGPVVLINAENKNRKELAFLLQAIQQTEPKVVALDILFADRKGDDDTLLHKLFQQYNNYVLPSYPDFEEPEQSIYNHPYFTTEKNNYVNFEGDDKETSTIRYYYPFNKEQQAFTTSILQKFNKSLYDQLLDKKGKRVEIHYFGNLANFTYFNFDEVMQADFDAAALKGKIVLVGYLGLPANNLTNKIDEDMIFTPLNAKLSGRSYPDMYGCVAHANILRMILEKDTIKVISPFTGFIISFLFIWLMLPLFCGLFFKGDVWFNGLGTGAQLVGSILLVYITVLVYRHLNTKFDPGLLMACFVLLPTFINLYEVLLLFLKYKLKLPIQSRFLKKDPND